MNNLREEMGTIGRIAKLEEDNKRLTEAFAKVAGAFLQKLADEGSELAKAAVQSLNEEE